MRRSPFLALLFLAALAAPDAAAQDTAPPRADRLGSVRTGVVMERVVSAVDTTRSWALYLPTGYDPARRWPILFVMDPRQRALVPLERLVEAAERYGYIVMSSYDSASDIIGPSPNEAALSAMLGDAQTLFSLDPRRLYLVGFSGTARSSWALGMRMTGNVAGIIGVGAGLPQSLSRTDLRPLRSHPEFSFYGLTGRHDYNYPEMRRFQRTLDAAGVANALEFFDGPHAWPPTEALTRAVEWMEIRAMASGLQPPDPMVAEAVRERWMAHAAGQEARGDTLEALGSYRRVERAFGPDLVDTRAASVRAAALAGLEGVVAAQRRVDELQDRTWTFFETLETLLFRAEFSADAPRAGELARSLGIDRLRNEAADSTDRLGADAAMRMLEQVYNEASFYRAQAFVQRGRTEHALAMLELGERVFPERPQTCLVRARALALTDRRRDAVAALRCAIQRGLPPEEAARDPALVPLHDLPAFRQLVG